MHFLKLIGQNIVLINSTRTVDIFKPVYQSKSPPKPLSLHQHKNCWNNLNLDVIFEFLGQFTFRIRCISLKKKKSNFGINLMHKTSS